MKIIAEIGWNHMGDMSLAKQFISEAAKSGVDYCKFQTWSVKNLQSGSWDNDGRREIYTKAELTEEKHYELKDHCEKNNVKFLTTIFNINDVKMLKNLTPSLIKIGSPEAYNIRLIEECLNNFEKVIVSTGATKWSELLQYKNFKKINNLILLHCVSAYPCELKNINLPKMAKLKEITNIVGYSGHYDGVDDAIAAISNNAAYIEKHFTINKKLPGRDNKFSILPEQMKFICDFRDKFLKMREFQGLDFQEVEQSVFVEARGRWSK